MMFVPVHKYCIWCTVDFLLHVCIKLFFCWYAYITVYWYTTLLCLFLQLNVFKQKPIRILIQFSIRIIEVFITDALGLYTIDADDFCHANCFLTLLTVTNRKNWLWNMFQVDNMYIEQSISDTQTTVC